MERIDDIKRKLHDLELTTAQDLEYVKDVGNSFDELSKYLKDNWKNLSEEERLDLLDEMNNASENFARVFENIDGMARGMASIYMIALTIDKIMNSMEY